MLMPKLDVSLYKRLALSASLCGLLGACATDDDSLSRLAVAPGNYRIYNCAQLMVQTKSISEREQKLIALMQKAETSSSGRLVSEMSYRPEYLVAHGQLRELHATAVAKNCNTMLGTPASGTPSIMPARKSDTFIR
jgi:hypothetical protein